MGQFGDKKNPSSIISLSYPLREKHQIWDSDF